MKSFKEAFAQLFDAVTSEIEAETEEKKFAEARLDSGDVIEAESFEPGNEVFLISEDGSRTPLGEGEYMLEDGSRIMVDAEGMIAEFVPAQAEEEEMAKEKSETEEAKYATVEDFEKFKDEFKAEILEALGQVAEAHKAEQAKHQSELESKKGEIEQLKNKLHKPDPIEEKEEKQAFQMKPRNVRNKFEDTTTKRLRQNLEQAQA